MKNDFLLDDSVVLLGFSDLKDAYVRKRDIRSILNYSKNNKYSGKQDLINDLNDFLDDIKA